MKHPWHVPVQPVKVLKRDKAGKVVEDVDPGGGIFAPVPGKAMRPAYSYGPDGRGTTRDVLFQCPVSAIPLEVLDLLAAWWRCKQLGLPYAPGGAADQPGIVQYAFPFYEAQWRSVERDRNGPEKAAALAVAATMQAMFGGKAKT